MKRQKWFELEEAARKFYYKSKHSSSSFRALFYFGVANYKKSDYVGFDTAIAAFERAENMEPEDAQL